MYADNDYSGSSYHTCGGDKPVLNDYGFNDRISSIRNGHTCKYHFYQHEWYQGWLVAVDPGASIAALYAYGANDKISSMAQYCY